MTATFVSTIKFRSYSCYFTSQTSDHLLQFEMLKTFYESPHLKKMTNLSVTFFKICEFKNGMKNIPCQNFPRKVFVVFFDQISYIFDQHALLHEGWIHKGVSFLIKKLNNLLKAYNKAIKHSNFNLIGNL